MTLKRVLVIEDNEIDFLLIERALGEEFATARASTLTQGLKRGTSERFDLIVLDLTLDDSCGYETFARAHAALGETPILVLSGLDDEELALRAVSSGAQDYIPKSRLLDYPLDRTARYAIERQLYQDNARKAELQYRTLLENLPTAAFTCDADGLITQFNQAAVELWGRTPKLNDPSHRFSGSFKLYDVEGNPIEHSESYMAKCLREHRAFNGWEMVIELPTGERRTVLAHVNPVIDERNVLRSAIAVLVDITSQRRAEREARESERFARSIVDSLESHIAILDEDGRVLAVNAAWKRFAEQNGMQSSGFGVGANYLNTCDAATDNCAQTACVAAAGIRSVLRGERSNFYLEYPCDSPVGESWFAMCATPFDGEGPKRVVIAHSNVTSRKLAERLAREQCGLQEAIAGMEQVLGVVGHELRTPLAALRAISEFLLTDGALDTAEAKQFLLEISQEVDRMSDTVNNLLEAARLNSGRAIWNWSEFDLAETVADTIASIQPLIDKRRVEVVNHVAPMKSQMLGDAEAIRRLLLNLLSNSRKHTGEGTIQISARSSTTVDGDWVELCVEDTGPGITPERLLRLGEAFALNSGVVGNNHVSGAGLGLAICKGIAAAHGGDLRIESVLGRGTTVTARLRVDLETAATGECERLESCESVPA